MTRSTAGRLLVATPALGDPNFERTVVLMLEHSDEGALGLVLNDPMDTPVRDMLPAWAGLTHEPSIFFQGGPVGLDGVIGLADGPEDSAEGWSPMLGRLGTVDLNLEPDAVGVTLEVVRMFAGHAGWAPGQLDDELDADAWYVVDVHVDDIFSSTPETLWHEVLRRQPAPLSWLANYPNDPDAN